MAWKIHYSWEVENMKRKWKWEAGGLGGIGFHVEEFDSKYICSRKCFGRTVLLIKISIGSAIPQVLRNIMCTATMCKLISETPAVYIHNWFTRRIGEKAALLKTDWELTAIFYYHYLIVVFHTVGILLPELGEPLYFHFSLTTFLQGKQKLTNQKFAHVEPQENI